MTAAVAVATTSLLVGVLEEARSAIREQHPQVPEVVVVVAAGSDGRTRDWLKLGRFALRWHVGEAQRAEVLVGGEGADTRASRGAGDVAARGDARAGADP